ncbi:Alpha-D-ribose 1-methylphosphonate 5-triphosphate diphosphatase [Roseivivax jejudonensis]|uniref:Alpha-D-ribose 1-methylphosphonate 5-triphosphate diphosphatase n=1 Tax=Roseivivax jejudonensis TaxID=1529041 RepID=A0A1X6ZTM7_9RHOB|nr:alpha-D-ribose 1-methylphosphonate 5-triphosphate diphosphatase [Roseivivax jejudonensis]SLN61303.1 Alpha-D-ribose 1-methylphosphonate 5-triphosphate diphosphatase [Roseivivax jejudonensis]
MTEIILTNARIVAPEEVIHGTLVLRNGVVADISGGSSAARGAEDCGGDHLIPGLIELHTDNLERHIEPRPGVDWPHMTAILAHDGELASAGITTVFDAMRVGSIVTDNETDYAQYARALSREMFALRAKGALRISHFLHLRAEVCSETLLDELGEFGPEDRVGILSIMDHTPGQRQFRDVSKLRAYVMGKHGVDEAGFQRHVAGLKALQERFGAAHEAGAVEAAHRLGAVLASHDDTTEAQVATSAGHGVRLAEFPTTEEAATACHAHDIAVMMGAPNLIRGGSHSGNVAAETLARVDRLDILSSDYIPSSLMLGAFRLGTLWDDLPRAIRTVTDAPARATGLADRGRLAPGLRGDVVRVVEVDGTPVVHGVWSQGRKVG